MMEQPISNPFQNILDNNEKLLWCAHAMEHTYEVFKTLKQISADVKTDFNFPNALRPETNPGYQGDYTPR